MHTYTDLLKSLLWPNAVASASILPHAIPPFQELATICEGPGGFKVKLDVHHFSPKEISVKTQGHMIVVEAHHEEKQDTPYSYITQSFVRRYTVADEFDINHVGCALSSDGILSITAPKAHIDPTSGLISRPVPLMLTGPSMAQKPPGPTTVHHYPEVHSDVPIHSGKPASHHTLN